MHLPVSSRTLAALGVAAAMLALASRAQEIDEERTPPPPNPPPPTTAPVRPNAQPGRNRRMPAEPESQDPLRRPQRPAPLQTAPQQQPPSGPPRGSIAPTTPPAAQQPGATRATEPGPITPVDKREVGKSARTVVMSFDKRDIAEVIQFVSQFTQRNFILPERVAGKITILSNSPIPADEVWNVFVAALDANNWAVYPVGRYWKLVEKKQSSRANIPTFIESGTDAPPTEQMVTKLFKLRYVEADQMRNVLNQFTSRDADFQIFPPDTLIISDLGLNMRRLERLIEQLDHPGGSEEIHIVPVQYAGAQELAQKLGEIFQAQAPGQRPGQPRQLGIVEGVQPGQPPQVPGAPSQAAGGGPVQISKIIPEERTNKLIVIAGARSFARVLQLIKQLDVPAGEGGVHVYYLENAKAEEVASTLQALAQGTSGSRQATHRAPGVPAPPGPAVGAAAPGAVSADLFAGEVKITADKNTNSLVVIASQADYRNLIKVVEKLDIRRRQVFVEAVIMEVNLQNELDIGVSAHGGTVINDVSFRGTRGPAPLVIGSELGGLNSLGGVSSLGSLGGFLAGLQGPPITVPGVNITIPSFAILLNALQSSSDVNVISTPHVIMTDNTEGEITVGQNVPFQAGYAPNLGGLTSSVTPTTTGGTTTPAVSSLLGLGGLGSLYAPIQRQNVELRLRIKPQINESDYVRLEVDEQTEEIAEVDRQLGPTTSKRTAKTTVVAKDQETVVLGGLIQERTIKGVKKVPVLGSLPVVGWLFRNDTTKKTKTNLLLFLTPYIIRDQSDYRRIFERKMAERAEFVKRFYGDEAAYEAPVDYDKKPGPLRRLHRGVQEELTKLEYGGPGSAGERVIGPQQRYAPPQMDQSRPTRPPPAPAPLAPEPKVEPAPGVQQPVQRKEDQAPREEKPTPPPPPEENAPRGR